MDVRLTDAAGDRVAYARVDTDAAANRGPTVLMLHGLGGDHRQALDLLPPDWSGVRIAPDMPGHGHTPIRPDDELTFGNFAGHAARLIDDLQQTGQIASGPVQVVGVSMGAAIATVLAASRPDLVQRLVLVRPAWLEEVPVPNLEPFPVIAGLLRARGAVEGKKAFRTSSRYRRIKEQSPAMAESLLGQFTRPDAVERAGVLAKMPAQLPLPDRAAYADLTMPSLVVVAPDDPVHPLALGQALAGWLPDTRLVTVASKRLDPTVYQSEIHRAIESFVGSEHAS